MAMTLSPQRAALRERLVEVAEAQIAKDGLRTLRARDLAKVAGCSVGAIYNVFDDLTALTLEVNGRTFRKLGARVAAATQNLEGLPKDHLIALSLAYLDFASEHPKLWRALFDLEMSRDSGAPQWYRDELEILFAHIADPLARLFPNEGPEGIALLTRGLFSSVHGIVLLGLEERISAVPRDQIATMIHRLLTNFH
ncbi:MAG: TetR/AcrR family transcriptional regulator [Marinovum sp.]|nr:TetR/AcrR family transcriptional regulator [Marinovum sp.]